MSARGFWISGTSPDVLVPERCEEVAARVRDMGRQALAVVCGACKPAMLDFTRTMALELAEHRIRVDAIAPDYAVTPGLRGNHAGPVDPAGWIEPGARRGSGDAGYFVAPRRP